MEKDIIHLLEEVQRADSFGFVLVTHNLELAKRAQRAYEMRQGALVPAIGAEAERQPRHFGPAKIAVRPALTVPAVARAPIRLGSNLLPGLQTFLLTGAIVLGGVL